MKRLIVSSTYQVLDQQLLSEHLSYLRQGRLALYILPTQHLLRRAREMARQAGLGATTGLDFASIDDVVELILERAGRQLKPIDFMTQRLIVARILRELDEGGQLQYLRNMGSYPGVVQRMLQLMSELRRANVPVDAAVLTGDSRKDHDIFAVYRAYQDFLRRNRWRDLEEGYLAAVDCCQQAGVLSGLQQVVIDGFADFTPLQLSLIAVLGEAVPITVTLTSDRERPLLFDHTERLVERFEKLDFCVHRQPRQTGEHLADHLFAVVPPQRPSAPEVSVTRCWSIRQEVVEAARAIKELVLSNAAELNEIGLVVPDPNRYLPVLQQEFSKAGIPVAYRDSISLVQSAAAAHLLALMAVVSENWSQQAFVRLLRGRLYRWPEQINHSLLLDFVQRTPHVGDLESWIDLCRRQRRYYEGLLGQETEEDSLLYSDPEHEIERLRQVEQGLTYLARLWQCSLPQQGSLADLAAGLRSLTQELDMEAAVMQLFHELDFATAAQVYSGWCRTVAELDRLTQLQDLWPDSSLTVEEFEALLTDALADLDLTTGARAAAGISIFSPSSIRGMSFKHLFCLGLNDGVFPQSTRRDWLLGEQHTRQTQRPDVMLAGAEEFLSQQRMLFYLMVQACTEKLYFSYAGQHGGQELFSSPFLAEVMRFTPCRQRRLSPGSWLAISDSSAITAVERHQLRAQQGMSVDPELQRRIQIEQKRTQTADFSYMGQLQEQTLLEDLHRRFTRTRFSTSAFRQYARCPFSFYIERVLRLRPLDELDNYVTPLSRGNLLHSVLAAFLRQYTGETLKPERREQYRSQLCQLLDEQLQDLKQQLPEQGQAIFTFERDRLQNVLWRWLEREMEYQQKVALRPMYLEYRFAGDDALTIGPAEDPVIVEGIIDRIDADDGSFVVYDYKSGRAPRLKDIREGLDFQIPVYLRAALNLFQGNKQALGGGYYSLKDFSRNHGMWRSEFLQQVNLSSRIGDQLALEEWNAVFEEAQARLVAFREQMRQGDFRVTPRDPDTCRYCSASAICRFNEELALILAEEEEDHAVNP